MAKTIQRSDDLCPYFEDISSYLSARRDWDENDTDIIKRRKGSRPKVKSYPYPGAPNAIENILDQNTCEKTDNEITMNMNAPSLAYFIPLVEGVPVDGVMKVQRAFDTFLRHILNFRQKKEEAMDTKNLRGFSVSKLIRRKDPRFDLIPDFETVDPKDVIMSPLTRVPASMNSEKFAFVNRYSARQLKDKGNPTDGWDKNAITRVLEFLSHNREDEVMVRTNGLDETNVFKITETLIGVNTSSLSDDEIVVWEIPHYAHDWDVTRNKLIKKGERCVSYICPDMPDALLHSKPWTRYQGLWPIVQNRYSYASRTWYDSQGIGHKCMDNHIAATSLLNTILIYMSYFAHPMFQANEAGASKLTFMPGPGKVIPFGLQRFEMGDPPQMLSFMLDYFKRMAGVISGAGQNLFSAEMSQKRTLEKSATEASLQAANQSMISTASADRFNDPDKELFWMLWSDLAELKYQLPIINNNKFGGYIDPDMYDVPFLIIPAASQKTLNPDMQYMKDKDAFMLAAQFMDKMPIQLQEGLRHVLTRHDPNFAEVLLGNNGSEPPIYVLMKQLFQVVTQLGQTNQSQDKQIEQLQKLAVETAEKHQEMEFKASQKEPTNVG